MARETIWRAIAGKLSAEIAAGHYRPGDKLPTEAELSARFDVNRHTARRALAHLAEAGLVRSRRGSEVFVTARPTEYPLGRRMRFHQSVEASGRTPSRRITRLETRAADAREAAALKLEPGRRVHVVEGISLVDGRPLAFFRSIFDAGRLPNLLAELEKTSSVTAALAACGVADHIRASTRLTARLASAALAPALEIQPGAPILRTEAVNLDAEGRPVEYGRAWFVGDRVALTMAPEA